VLPAWSEPLHAVISRRHPAATREVVGISDLAAGVLRMPSRKHDPSLHDAIIAALRAAGAAPSLGRADGHHTGHGRGGRLGPHSWALLPADQLAEIDSTRVRAVRSTPPIAVTGNVVTVEHHPTASAMCQLTAVRTHTRTHRRAAPWRRSQISNVVNPYGRPGVTNDPRVTTR